MHTLRFGDPSMCLWIYGADLSLLTLNECPICCTDRQLSKENGMGPLRPFCHKSCHIDQLCREGGIGEKWEEFPCDCFPRVFFFSMYESKVPFLHINAFKTKFKKPGTFTRPLITQKQCLWTVAVSQRRSLHIHASFSKQVEWERHLSNGPGKDLLVFLQKHVC